MNFFDHKDLGNHFLQLCPKVVKHPVCATREGGWKRAEYIYFTGYQDTTFTHVIKDTILRSVHRDCSKKSKFMGPYIYIYI